MTMRLRRLQGVAAALVSLSAIPQIALAQSAPLSSRPAPSTRDQIAGYVSEASQRFSVPEAWIVAVMRVESAGDPTATSTAGAMGLMQVMSSTYEALRARLGLGADPYDPHDNIMAGAAYLRELHDRYGAVGFLAAYNAGPGRWEDHLAGVRLLPPETVRYMARLAPMLGERDASALALAVSPAVVAPEAAPIFVALSTRQAATSPRLTSPATVQVAAVDAPENWPMDSLFSPRRSAAGPPSNAGGESGDTARFPSRPLAPTAGATPPSAPRNPLFMPRTPSREQPR